MRKIIIMKTYIVIDVQSYFYNNDFFFNGPFLKRIFKLGDLMMKTSTLISSCITCYSIIALLKTMNFDSGWLYTEKFDSRKPPSLGVPAPSLKEKGPGSLLDVLNAS